MDNSRRPTPPAATLPVYLVTFLHPLPSEIPEECSICREPFDQHPEETPLMPDLPDCHHIFGSACLWKHLASDGEWANKCPECRAVWYERDDEHDVRFLSYDDIQRSVTQARVGLERLGGATAAERALIQDIAEMARSLREDIVILGESTHNVDQLIAAAVRILSRNLVVNDK